jgi:glycine/D-amino acid oxidase-like deaminating enzyme
MEYGNGLPGLAEDRYMNFSSAPAIDKKIYDLTAENIRTLSKLSASTGIDCELETNGVLQVLGTSEDMRPAKAYVQQARSLGTPVEFGDEQRLVDTIGTEVYKAAFFDPNGGHIHPMKLVHVSKGRCRERRRGDLRRHNRSPHRGRSGEPSSYEHRTFDQGKVVGVGD